MSCTYGIVTCACNDTALDVRWKCGVCPATRPSEFGLCPGNTSFECRYGADTCFCNGGTWQCATPMCTAPPFSFIWECSWPGLYTCQFPALDQYCSCGSREGTACSCPAVAPIEGSSCIGPVGPEWSGCAYDDQSCDCIEGQWRCSVCPIRMPTNAAPCPAEANCAYDTGFCYCDGVTWACF